MLKSHGNIHLTGILALFLIFVATLVLQSCTGTKLLEEPIPVADSKPLSQSTDEKISASLSWVVVRDGPGTWAKNADWDEYWISVSNLSNHDIQLTEVVITDSLETPLESSSKRSALVRESRKTVGRYEDRDLEITAGLGAIGLLSASAASGAAGVAVINSMGVFSTGAGMVGIATVIAVPALAIAGVYRGIKDREVSNEIRDRQTKLPLILREGDTRLLTLFFPLAPSPKQIAVSYKWTNGQGSLIIDTSEELMGLHMVPASSSKFDIRPEGEKDADLLKD